MRTFRLLVVAALVAVGVAMVTPARSAETRTIVFNGEDNRLNAYDAATGEKQTVIHSAADAESGAHTSPSPARDINAQLCFFPDGSRRFIAGEDTGQGSSGVDGQPGWGIFQLKGDRIGELSAEQVGKLKPTFQTSDNAEENEPYESNPENYGCGFLSDGRVLTGDVGNQYPLTPNNGQLIVWFPDPLKGFNSFDLKYCKIDIEIPTSGGIYVDAQDRIYIASNRPGFPDLSRFGGIYRYTGPFPTSDTPAGGCDSKDETGAPMTTKVTAEQFIMALPGIELATPSAIVSNGNGGFYVSSVFDGKIAEYDGDGGFQRFVLQPGPGELPPYAHGTPFGIGVGPDGSLYYANLGILLAVPGPGLGTVERIRFENGEPQTPEIMDKGLEFPDGIGILEVGVEPAPAPAPAPAQVKGVQAARDASTLPATGGAGISVLGLVLLAGALAAGMGARAKLRG
jgi:hypothetical protein